MVNANDLYAARRRDITALLDWLGLEVDKHADYAGEEGLTFAHAGDLGHVRNKLVEALSFLAQRDKSDIESALDDAAAGREGS